MALLKDTVLDNGLTGKGGLVGGTRSMRDVIKYMLEDGRSVVTAFGDSTVRHGSIGMYGAITDSLSDWVAEAGKILPINCNFAYNPNGDGLIHTRRRDNSSSKLGLSQSLPASWDGQYINYGATGWVGPEPALLGRTTLPAGIDAVVTTINVTSTDEFPSSGRMRIDDEVIQYTGKTSTSFTGCTRGNISTTAAAHLANAVVSFVSLNNSNTAWNISQTSPLNPRGNIIQTLFYTPNGSTVSYSSFTFAYGTCPNFEQTSAITNRNVGTAITITGTAVTGGNFATVEHGYSGANLESLTMVSGQEQWSGGAFKGVIGPGFIRSMFFGDKDRSTGFITASPISQGGKTLNHLLIELLTDSNNKAGFAKYLWDYAKVRETSMGGNGSSRLTVFNIWGHNESGTSGILSSFVNPAYPWTIKSETYVISDSGTSIEVNDATGFNTTGMLGGHILINNERIKYTTLTGNVFSGLTRGFAGTTSTTHGTSDAVYQGYLPCHPDGIAADLLFFWDILKEAWTSNPTSGGSYTEDQIDFIYVRPTCMSDTPVAIDDSTSVTNENNREYKFQRFAKVISERLTGIIPGFILLDLGSEMTYAERINRNWCVSESDNIHDTYLGYKIPLARAISRHMRGGGKRSSDL